MGFGLFGKVPQKRDFLAYNLPNAVLNPIETWLQAGVAASRAELGEAWQDHYLVAPLWRFWIGKDVFGTACAGALMPSVDQAGRYFPLTILYCADTGETLSSPLISPHDEWYENIEARLLAALSEEDDGYLGSILSGLAGPAEDAVAGPAASLEIAEGEAAGDDPKPELSGAMTARPLKRGQTLIVPDQQLWDHRAELLELDHTHAAASRSYWWCAQSGSGPARLHASPGLPDPYFFSSMLRWDG